MSRATTVTKLPLARWAQIMGLHPLHFEQVRMENITNPHCEEIMFQHEWQTADHVSREEIARAIAEAEIQIENQLGWRLAPAWEVDEWNPTIRPFQKDMMNWNAGNIRGLHNTVDAKWGYFISGGILAKTAIEAGAVIVYTDRDNDGYFETATVTVVTTVQDPSEIAIFYPGEDGDDTWEIRPINVVISGGSAVITFKRELAVIPEKLDAFDIEGAEALSDEDEDFLEEVDVYRRYNDPQTQASFLWEPGATGWCRVCSGEGCAACSYSAQTGCLLIVGDPRQSIVAYHPAEWDSDTNTFDTQAWTMSRHPDIVRLYYYAGWRNKSQRFTNRMDPQWERAVAYFAASLLDRPPCSCIKGGWDHWRADLALTSGDEDGRPHYRDPSGMMGLSIMDNPFGSRQGAIFAWRKVLPMIRAMAVAM